MGPRRFLRVFGHPSPAARWLSVDTAKEYLAERGIGLSERYFVRTIMTQVGGKIDGRWYCSAAELERWLESRLVRRGASTEAPPTPATAPEPPEVTTRAPAPAPTKGKPFVSRKLSASASARVERLRRDPK